jgi:TfoX/Sxy family transcriptional regulator of competence genes
MTHDEDLTDRIRHVLGGRRDVIEKKMFGGVAFMVRGHMACGTVRGSLMVRLGEEGAAAALKKPHVEPMDFTGKVLKTMAYVRADGICTVDELEKWVHRAVDFALTLSSKSSPSSKKKVRRS